MTDVLVRPSPIDTKDSERSSSSISVDDGRWTYPVGPLAIGAIGLVVVALASSSSSTSTINRDVVSNRVVKVSQPVIIVLDGQRSITTTGIR